MHVRARWLRFRLSQVVALACAGVLSGCGGGSAGPTAATTDSGPASAPRSVSAKEINGYVAEIESFWAKRGSDAGVAVYRPVGPARVRQITQRPLQCDGQPIDLTDVEGNAVAFDCAEGGAVVWDLTFANELSRKYGPASPAMLIAHEFGHIVGYQAKAEFTPVVAEQYADCMAGVWVADAVDRGDPPFDVPGALDATVATAPDLADTPGDSANDPDAHGLAFDRIRAFQEGFNGSAKTCAAYETTPPVLTETPFTADDKKDKGNIPFDEARAEGVAALGEFIALHPTQFAGATVGLTSMSADDLKSLHGNIGDGATFAVLASDTFGSRQVDTPNDAAKGKETLTQACLVGSWLGWLAADASKNLALSAGDLDEAVAAFTSQADPGTPDLLFDRVNYLRSGFTDGIDSCTAA